ncbi:MAG: hypothetical protein NT166_01920 [Candidatus Aminicenantes bacterium]|nr:hypothetical protein [Candidatus Aminicenantes bacterium]
MSRTFFKTTIFAFVFLSLLFNLQAEYRVKTVNFLKQYGLDVNGAGPMLVKTDIPRNRITLVNTNTSSISIIDGKQDNYPVVNIPVKSRVLQYLKMEALTIDNRTGNIYIIGNKNLHIVLPDQKKAVSIDTGEQYEMVAVNEKNGDAFLVGRESKALLMIAFETQKVTRIPWLDTVEKMANLNQTPPPPIRKVICDTSLQEVAAVDGYTSTLYLFSAKTGKLIKKRPLPVKGGVRWHLAGYNENTHNLYMVIETDKRVVQEAVKIDIAKNKDVVVPLPGLTEGVGVNYNPKREEVYIPYDNHPSVHVVDFKNNGTVHEIKIPTYGNDASAIDEAGNLLYVSCWGYGEIEVINLETRSLVKRIRDVGIIPHMFNMTFNPHTGRLIIPIGASAVNGSFGAALTVLDPVSEKMQKIYTGWAPAALAEMKAKEGFLVFNSEDEAAEVTPEGTFKTHRLPCQFANNAIKTPSGNIYLSYGPHQSYWPVVYIWAAKNGILGIDPDTMTYYDRRIPRLAHQMVPDKDGALFLLQNNWGLEKQFLFTLPDEVRGPNLDQLHVEPGDMVLRETTQRILKYDARKHWLYIVRVGETDDEPGSLQIYDLAAQKVLLKYPVGLSPTDLVFDETFIYISAFDSDMIAVVDKDDFSVQKIRTGKKPFKMAILDSALYVINHNDNSLQVFGKEPGTYPLPYPGRPDNICDAGGAVIITAHSPEAFYILSFSPVTKSFETVHKEMYPYGETTVDTDNSAFYLRGQFGDGIFEINQIKQDRKGRLWVTDYLSGKLFIICNSQGGSLNGLNFK